MMEVKAFTYYLKSVEIFKAGLRQKAMNVFEGQENLNKAPAPAAPAHSPYLYHSQHLGSTHWDSVCAVLCLLLVATLVSLMSFVARGYTTLHLAQHCYYLSAFSLISVVL